MTLEHASHSAINSYTRCGKAFELDYIKHYPQIPAWWLIGGSAVHKFTEAWDIGDRWTTPNRMAIDFLVEEVDKALHVEPDQDKWLAAGWGKNGQTFNHWSDKVVKYANQWVAQDWSYDGDMRWVELDVSMVLPSGILVKGFVDRVKVYHGEDVGFIEITDLKSGSTRPDSDQQLGIYSVLVKEYLKTHQGLALEKYFIQASNYMFKDDEYYEMDVSRWNLATVDKLVQAWYGGVKAEAFVPNRGSNCDRCGLAAACYLASGDTSTTRQYDVLNPMYGVVNG